MMATTELNHYTERLLCLIQIYNHPSTLEFYSFCIYYTLSMALFDLYGDWILHMRDAIVQQSNFFLLILAEFSSIGAT